MSRYQQFSEANLAESRERIRAYVANIKRMQMKFEKENADFLNSDQWKNQKAAALSMPEDKDIYENLELNGADAGEAREKGWNL